MVYVSLVRSPYAHAKITKVDKTRAKRLPGVIDVVVSADLEGNASTSVLTQKSYSATKIWCLAKDKVRYSGEPIAAILARDRFVAEDAVGHVDVTVILCPLQLTLKNR